MGIPFVYSALIRFHDDDRPELLGENCDTALVDYDLSNDLGQYGQFLQEALDVLRAKGDHPDEGTYIVLLAGKMCFGEYWTDCGMEYDSWLEVEWSHARMQLDDNRATADEFELAV